MLPQRPKLEHLRNKSIVRYEKNVIHMTNGCQIILNVLHPISELITGSPRDQSTTPFEPFTCDMRKYGDRLKTFNQKWILDFLTPRQLAKAGFYYLGKQDRVRCTYCSLEMDYWQRGDDPFISHKRATPQCQFFNENEGYDVCGLYEPPFNDNDIQIIHFLESTGVVQQIASEFKEFTSFESRLKTFDKCKIDLKQEVHSLCEAGFLYIGNGFNDCVLCFCCGHSLKEWEDSDDTWTEHARWSPKCSYVLLNKGKSFVDKAQGKRDKVLKLNQEELSMLIADDKNSFTLEDNTKVNSVQRMLDHLDITEKNQIKTASVEVDLRRQQDPITVLDSKLCKICYKEEMKVAFLPCGHVIACIECAMTLDQCAVCRQSYSLAMRVDIIVDEQNIEDVSQSPSSSSKCSDESLNPMLCKVCHEEEMDAAFIPCSHVYACMKCTIKMKNNCLVCSEEFCATMQIYL